MQLSTSFSLWWIIPAAALVAIAAYVLGSRLGPALPHEASASPPNSEAQPNTQQSATQPTARSAAQTTQGQASARPETSSLLKTPANQNSRRQLVARAFAPNALDFWWVTVPTRLRRYSVTFSAAWADGVYLTAWPRLAVSLSIFAVLIGCALGASHWSPYVIGEYSISATGPIIVFAQSLPFLFIVVLLGGLSAHLGVMLTLGYIVGDYLIAGPATSTLGSNSAWPLFFGERLPLFLCYWLLFMLAARTTLTSNSLGASLLRSLRGNDKATRILRVGATAAFQFALVYAWAVATPMIIRTVWLWTSGHASPIVVPDYLKVTAPWLPIAAAAAVVVRGFVMPRALSRNPVAKRVRRLESLRRYADLAPAFSRRMPLSLRAIIAAGAMTFLISGILLSYQYAAGMFVLISAILLARALVLPKLSVWTTWARAAARVPLAARLVAGVVVVFLISRFLVATPGQLDTQGKFGIELICLAIGFPIMLLLAGNGEREGPAVSSTDGLKLQTIKKAAVTAVLLFSVLSPTNAYANCLDDSCCLVTFAIAGLLVGALIILGIEFVLPMIGIDLLIVALEDFLIGEEATSSAVLEEKLADMFARILAAKGRIFAAGVLSAVLSGLAELGGSVLGDESERREGDDSIESDEIPQGFVGGLAGGVGGTVLEGGVNLGAEAVGHVVADTTSDPGVAVKIAIGAAVVVSAVGTVVEVSTEAVVARTLETVNSLGEPQSQKDLDTARQELQKIQQQNANAQATHTEPWRMSQDPLFKDDRAGY